jgi:phosphosulfolactate synthase
VTPPTVVAFETIPIPPRQAKPRTRGINMMIDWGMGLARQLDTLESAGPYIDIAKIAATIPRVTSRDYLKRKLDAYRDHGVTPSIGGLFVELTWKQGTYAKLLDEALALGFGAVEISDNLLAFPPQEKARAIRQCVDAGLKAYGEVGKKEGALDDAQFLGDIDNCLQAGASAVFLEADELFGRGEVRSALIAEIAKRFAAERILYELPVVILPGVHREFKHRITTWLVRALGTEVNLANIEWDEIYITEMVRRGMAGDTSHPQGAYRLAGFGSGE